MELYQNIIFTIFFIILAMIIIDENVGIYIIIKLKTVKLNFERIIWMIRFHPNNPIGRWLLTRRSYKLAKELQEEYGIIPEKENGGDFKDKIL
jgi:5-bromo-4-chloroindolyl phosphate hydrolysis protein